ncbi:2-isopropylmalate synthase [Papillibacter cinnamivorans]|uniref:2-isopropylmalate synthase n=1 Tax=Papillibacter cinnamivorans DSM 12816 TaxID=1122930 RepID=A0A1W1ZD15_9FIRM|nr:2-isopropylmalate synthase [Papillibacter cinnamivorans]SMC46284.1 2-isopropylmalate synthase [Papillibacter cinnamivorans DSM 12816]
MNQGFKKYIPFRPEVMLTRDWPSRVVTRAPVWCSVDLRDGNQALVDPMGMEAKLAMFKTLVEIGIKEIEVGFPSSSETEYEIIRELIEGGHIPDDVTIQVLVQARPELIEKTFEAIQGAKNVIVHFYNSTSTLQRKVVFRSDMDGIVDIAVNAARLIRELSKKMEGSGTNLRFEYSPESFSGTEMDNAVLICQRVIEEIGATPENKIILNLPSTVEGSMPNLYADQLEYFCKRLPGIGSAVISVHPHNDRGTAVATAELALLAGAERIEGTLFGNGERTGNVDLVTLAMNMYSQGIDPGLDFSDINRIRDVYEKATGMRVHERHPYVGALVFTAFSGSHQDAISKGMSYMVSSSTPFWEVPYLPIDPADVGRQYEPVIRINNQSGKGGAAFIMQTNFGFDLPKAMHPEFGAVVKTECDRTGTELPPEEIFRLFQQEYIDIKEPYSLIRHKFQEENGETGEPHVVFSGTICYSGKNFEVTGEGNGPIDAFFNAVGGMRISGFKFLSYSEHAVSTGSDSMAVAYIQLLSPAGVPVFGVGISHNINLASIRGVLCAINRAVKKA